MKAKFCTLNFLIKRQNILVFYITLPVPFVITLIVHIMFGKPFPKM